jgi:hypothetical protein
MIFLNNFTITKFQRETGRLSLKRELQMHHKKYLKHKRHQQRRVFLENKRNYFSMELCLLPCFAEPTTGALYN